MAAHSDAGRRAASRFGLWGSGLILLGFASFILLQLRGVSWAPACVFAGLAAAGFLGAAVFWRAGRAAPRYPADLMFIASLALVGGASAAFTALVFVVPTGTMPQGAAAWVLTGAALGLGLLGLALLLISLAWAARMARPPREEIAGQLKDRHASEP